MIAPLGDLVTSLGGAPADCLPLSEQPESALRRHPTVVDMIGPPAMARAGCKSPRVNGLTRLMPRNIPVGNTHCLEGEQ
jgi:hypothetical protein